MKKIGKAMSICMGVTLSFFLALLGNLLGGHFTAVGFLVSFLLSTLLSLLIGAWIPMHQVSSSACKRAGIPPHSPQGNALSALISDLFYTPVITLCNTVLAYFNAAVHGGQVPFIKMFVPALMISLIAAYVLIYCLTPFFLNIILKKNGIRPESLDDPPQD